MPANTRIVVYLTPHAAAAARAASQSAGQAFSEWVGDLIHARLGMALEAPAPSSPRGRRATNLCREHVFTAAPCTWCETSRPRGPSMFRYGIPRGKSVEWEAHLFCGQLCRSLFASARAGHDAYPHGTPPDLYTPAEKPRPDHRAAYRKGWDAARGVS